MERERERERQVECSLFAANHTLSMYAKASFAEADKGH